MAYRAKRGDTWFIPLSFYSDDNVAYEFTTSGFTNAPAAGDRYMVNGVLFFVVGVIGNNVKARALTSEQVPTSGTLVKYQGDGDSSISYSALAVVTAIDISTYHIKFSLKRSLTDGDDKALVSETNDPDEHYAPDLGKTLIEIESVRTSDIPAGMYFAEVQMTAENGAVSSSDTFDFIVEEDINNAA